MDLNDTAVREQLLNKHPIVRADYTVITPMISNAYSMVRELIWQRRTGLFMYAHPRMGKTLCACAVRQLISAEFPDKYAVYHIADDNRHVNFLRELVVSIGQVKGGHEAYSLLLEKFILHVKSQLSALDGNHFVLIVDEIQQVTLEHYNILLVIHNRLKSLGVSMTTVGFGQPTILDRRELMLSVSATNLVARFLSHAIKFDGCLNANTLMSILHQYDHEKEYPPDSGWSFTRFFLPKAYANGFRLSVYYEQLWEQLVLFVGADFLDRVPLEYVFRVIECLLIYNRYSDSDDFKFSDADLKTAIAQSNIGEFVALMQFKPGVS